MACTYTAYANSSGYFLAVCHVNNQRFISVNRTLLPLVNIQATDEDSRNNPLEYFTDVSSNAWCTAAGNGTLPGLHINLTFTEPVVISLIISGGFINGYVDNFTIGYMDAEDGGEFSVYGVLDSPQVRRVGCMKPEKCVLNCLVIISN